jgi:hypothetical protein
VTLLLCFLLPLSGCLVIPLLGDLPNADPNFQTIVGSANSDKLIRPGVSRRDVYNKLGWPHDSDASQIWSYYYGRTGFGRMLYIFLLGPEGGGIWQGYWPWTQSDEFLAIQYDSNGIVVSARTIDAKQFEKESENLERRGIHLKFNDTEISEPRVPRSDTTQATTRN